MAGARTRATRHSWRFKKMQKQIEKGKKNINGNGKQLLRALCTIFTHGSERTNWMCWRTNSSSSFLYFISLPVDSWTSYFHFFRPLLLVAINAKNGTISFSSFFFFLRTSFLFVALVWRGQRRGPTTGIVVANAEDDLGWRLSSLYVNSL